MHKRKLSFAADTNHQNQIRNIDYKMTKEIMFFALDLFIIDFP